jgi:periplasmic protein CpxP/Spy
MKKIALPLAAAVAVIALAGFAAAAERFARRDPQRAYNFITNKVNGMLDDIKATDAQRAQINQLKDKLFNEGMELRKSQRGLRRDLLANWDAPQLDPNAVHAQVDKRIDALRAFAHDAADASIQVHDILTPDQRAQVKQELQQRFKQHAKGTQGDAQQQ